MNAPQSILITGASSGIGEALALHYARENVSLFLCARNTQRLEDVAQACRQKGADVEAAVLDVTHQEALATWIISVDQKKPLDLLIANAGVSGGGAGHEHGEPVPQARGIFDVNLGGVLNTIEPALPRMIARGAGQIAVVSSLVGFRGWPGAPAYSASKGAVRFYGEALRGAVAHTGVKINVICPGFVRSRITDTNNFPMPFLMEAPKAAAIISKGLLKNKGRISFPCQTHFMSWLISILPDSLAQYVLRRLPKK